jgi:hypothetical protein
MDSIAETSRHLIVESGGWRRWVFSFVLMGLAIIATFLVITSFFPGDTFLERLTNAYAVLWENTTQRQFTFIMREQPWLLIIPGVTLVFVTGLLLPLSQWARAFYVYLAFGIGFLAGHVFW